MYNVFVTWKIFDLQRICDLECMLGIEKYLLPVLKSCTFSHNEEKIDFAHPHTPTHTLWSTLFSKTEAFHQVKMLFSKDKYNSKSSTLGSWVEQLCFATWESCCMIASLQQCKRRCKTGKFDAVITVTSICTENTQTPHFKPSVWAKVKHC